MRFKLDPLSSIGLSTDTDQPVRVVQSSNGYIGETKISGLITAGANVSLAGTGTKQDPYVITSSGGGGGGTISDGDKGDITVSSLGTVWSVDSGLPATRIGTGTVDNTEYGYLDGVTSAIQTQLNGKQATITNSDSITQGSTNLFLTTAERTKLSTTSGTNTGDQTITLTGDVTGSGTGSFVTTIKADAALAGNPTTTTQTAGNSTTRIATTAFVGTAISTNDALDVHLAGTETITGAKTFSVAPVVPSNSFPESAVTNLVTDLAAKQSTLSLTTTGTSGAATLVGATLNIPNYAVGGGGGVTITNTYNTIKTDIPGGTSPYGALTGLINGSNAVYTVSNGSYVAGTLEVFQGNVWRQPGNDFSETSPAAGTFTLTTAPTSGDFLAVRYVTQNTASGNTPQTYATKTTTYAMSASTDYGILANATGGAFNVTPPATTTAGYEVIIKKIDNGTNPVTVVGTIDGVTNYSLPSQNKYVRRVTTATSGTFYIVGNN